MQLRFISMEELNKLVDICRVLASAPFYQKLGPGGVLAIYLTAREMDLPPMYCLNGGMYNVEGKVVLSGQLINMMLVNAGWKIEFLEMTTEACHLRFGYPGGKRFEEFRYTIADAKKAGYFGIEAIDPNTGQVYYKKKPKDNWIYHPLDMLFNRCITSGGRKYAPNVIGNSYGVGELENDNEPMISNGELTQNEIPAKTPQSPAMLEDNRIQCPALDQALNQSVEQFKKRHNIVQGQPIYDYVVRISNQKKVNVDLAMELALKNEETFLKAFNDMQAKKQAAEMNHVAEAISEIAAAEHETSKQ